MGVELRPADGGIKDEDLTEGAPVMRALIVSRLELMWRGVEPFVDPEQGKPDPRFVEAGIRILDRLGRVFRIDDPASSKEQGQVGAARPPAELVAEQVAALEARMPGSGV